MPTNINRYFYVHASEQKNIEHNSNYKDQF